MIDFDDQVSKLLNMVDDRAKNLGAINCKKSYDSGFNLIVWLDYLKKSEITGTCDQLLEGFRASIVESAGCLTLGIVRPALFALRGQIDLSLSWIYFKDHPIEWRRVTEEGDGFMLKRDVISYLENYYPNFRTRINALTKTKRRKETDPYKILSAHVHSQSAITMPNYGQLYNMVGSIERIDDCIELQKEVSEFISDIFLSCFSDKWASLPESIVNDAKQRLGKEKTSAVFL